jgi:hypothetical protein
MDLRKPFLAFLRKLAGGALLFVATWLILVAVWGPWRENWLLGLAMLVAAYLVGTRGYRLFFGEETKAPPKP